MEDEEMPPTCPQCGGEGSYLGTLGKLVYLRCRACGWDWSEEGEK